MFVLVLPFYAFVRVRLQFLFTNVFRPGWTLRVLPNIFGMIQNGAHRVCRPNFANRTFLPELMNRAIYAATGFLLSFNIFVAIESNSFFPAGVTILPLLTPFATCLMSPAFSNCWSDFRATEPEPLKNRSGL